MKNKIELIHIRTSTSEQNPKNQLKDCLTLVSGNYEVVEEKQSAWKDKERILFESIKQRIQSGEISVYICWDLDRIYRNRKKLIGFFEFCKTYNCKILSFRQKFLNEMQNLKLPEGFEWIAEMQIQNFISFLGWISEDESQKKSDRVKIAHKNSKKKWGRKPLGKNVIEEVLDLRKKGMSIREISDNVFYWDKNKNKKNVSPSAVHKVIKENTLKH